MALYPIVKDDDDNEIEIELKVVFDEGKSFVIMNLEDTDGTEYGLYYIDELSQLDVLIQDLQEQRKNIMESIQRHGK